MSYIRFTIQDINGDRLQLITTKLISEGKKREGSYPGKIVRGIIKELKFSLAW